MACVGGNSVDDSMSSGDDSDSNNLRLASGVSMSETSLNLNVVN